MILIDSPYYRVEQTTGFKKGLVRPYFLRFEVSREIHMPVADDQVIFLIKAQKDLFSRIDEISSWVYENVEKSKQSYTSKYSNRQGWFLFRFKERSDLIQLKLAIS